jgi:hypothetical protein
VHTTEQAGGLKDPNSLVLGNYDEFHGVQEISINYTSSRELLDRTTTAVNSCFSTMVANLLNDPDPKTMAECKQCSDWIKWKEAIEANLDSLRKREVFSKVIPRPPRTYSVRFMWVFIQKWNENNEVMRYKVRLVAQGFTQRPGIDFNETYSPVMNGITFQYLLSLATQKCLSLLLMDVVTTYLYGSLDLNIYMKVADGISVLNANVGRNMFCVKLNKSLYGLKQSGRMWYNRLKEFLLNKGYSNNDDCPCDFIRKSSTGFCIISVYVDDLNIIATKLDINEARDHLKTEFEMKNLGKIKFCLGLQLEHHPICILVHHSAYVQKVLEKLNMDKAYPSKTLMIIRALEKDTGPFWPHQEGEEVLGSEYPYLSAIEALMYLANNTRIDIAFAVNLLARYSAAPTMRYWNGVKDVL